MPVSSSSPQALQIEFSYLGDNEDTNNSVPSHHPHPKPVATEALEIADE